MVDRTAICTWDVAVIGGGIAGATIAAEIAREGSAVLVERESQPGYHTSGRSAALFSEAYGNATIRGLSVGSRPFLASPPAGFADYPLLSPRGALHVGREQDRALLERLLAGASALAPSVRPVKAAEAISLVPALRPSYVAGGVLEPDAMDVDTHALLHGYLRLFRSRGGEVLTGAGVLAIERRGAGWRIVTEAGAVDARTVVNAAGAWCDPIAALAEVPPQGLEPKRRTAFLFEPPAGHNTREWPLVVGAREDFYVKPDAGMLLGSPADETPSPATDAQADEYDVAVAVERIQEAADLPVRRIARRWAGLRTFAPDRTPVVGYDPREGGFFWFGGQGGYGFQTAPAMGRVGAELLRGRPIPGDLADLGVAEAALAPGRFAAVDGRKVA